MRALLAAGLTAGLTVLTACGAGGTSNESSDSEKNTGGSSNGGAEVTNVGLLSDLPRNDGSFGQLTVEGAQAAADELGAKLTVVDNLQNNPSESKSALINLAKTNQVVLVVATAVMSSLPRVAAEYPDVTFAVTDEPIEGPNIFYQVQDWYPLGYLAGVAAATESKSGTVGFVSGGLIPPTIRAQEGYEAGAASVNPDIKVMATDTNSFDDPTLAKGAAAAQLAQGADVLAAFLNTAHAGVVQAAVEAGGTAQLIGVISPKCEESQGLELGDVMADQAASVEELVRLAAEGETESAVIGLTNPDVQQLLFCDDAEVSDELQQAVDAAWEAIASGEVEIPEAE